MRKTPSPRSRQLVVGIALLALGWTSIVLSVRYDLLVPSSLALEVTCGAAAARRDSDAHLSVQGDSPHISHQGPCHLRCLCQNMTSYLPRIHLHDRRSRRALAGRACSHLGLCKRFRSLLDRQKRRRRFRAAFWRALSVMQEYYPNVVASILEY